MRHPGNRTHINKDVVDVSDLAGRGVTGMLFENESIHETRTTL